jgi:PEGA domain-containing protein
VFGRHGWISVAVLILGCSSDTTGPGRGSGLGTVTGVVGTPFGTTVGPPGHVGATVSIAGRSTLALTSEYVLDSVPVGTHTITATLEGYEPFTGTVTVSSTDTTFFNIGLQPAALTQGGISAVPGPGLGDITVAWPAITGAVYDLYFAIQPGVTPATGTKVAGVSSPFVHSGRTPGTAYYYVLTAVSPTGETSTSPEVTATATTGIAFTIATDPEGPVVGEDLVLRVTVRSTLQVEQVSAAVSGRTINLAFQERVDGDFWMGTPDLQGLPAGPLLLTVTVRDLGGASGTGSRLLDFDPLPVVHLSSPAPFAVARPDLHLQATCTDDAPSSCSVLTVQAAPPDGGAPTGDIATAGTAIDQTISLAEFEGKSLMLVFQGRDSRGLLSRPVSVVVFVESSPRLQVVETVPGEILDADDSRALYRGLREGAPSILIRNRGSTLDQVVISKAGATFPTARLTPTGALVLEGPNTSSGTALHEWRNGVLVTLVDGLVFNLVVKGGFAIWGELGGLVRRDLASGMNTTNPIGSRGPADVASNGDVAFTNFALYRWVNGTTTMLENTGEYHAALTDGVNVIYIKEMFGFQIAIYTSSGEEVLTPLVNRSVGTYGINNGWAAFSKPDALGTPQVFTRPPGGDIVQVTHFASGSSTEALGPNGEVALLGLASSGAVRRYLSVPPYPLLPTEFGSILGTSFWVGETLYVRVGGTLFLVVP